MSLPVVPLHIFLALGFCFKLRLQLIEFGLNLLLSTLGSRALLPFVFQLGLEISQLLDEITPCLLSLLLLGSQLPLIVGLGRLQVNLAVKSMYS